MLGITRNLFLKIILVSRYVCVRVFVRLRFQLRGCSAQERSSVSACRKKLKTLIKSVQMVVENK